jgi:hypothetical protein
MDKCKGCRHAWYLLTYAGLYYALHAACMLHYACMLPAQGQLLTTFC